MLGDRLTKQIDEEFSRRDETVVKDAIDSAATEQRLVATALMASVLLSAIFVWATRRRLKARLDADAAIERHRRAELETLSIRFGLATQAARAGVYEVQEGVESLWWSDSMYELYGQDQTVFAPTVTGWAALVHPDDRAAANAALADALRERGELRARYRLTRADGSVRHVESLAAVVTDSVTARPRLVGIDIDVSDRVAAEQRERDLQAQLRDASRGAGMAEVATNVLHNVGNVLNSVNVSASLVMDRLDSSRVGALGRVATMLLERRAELGTFLSSDDRGRQLPDYLEQLAKHLRSEQQEAIGELRALRKNIDHIKDVVTMQQRYAKLAGVTETVDIATLVDDSLRLNGSAAERCTVNYEREVVDVPPIVVDKHKVLQILVNLVRNAKQACEAAGRVGGRVLVTVARRVDGVVIAVKDDGIGIPAENLTRIFSHGFTTKKNGHGFGLHGGALAARELGGQLHVASDGPGRGATFTLELPLHPPGAAHV
jgi:PAS domain S-box-containing protein